MSSKKSYREPIEQSRASPLERLPHGAHLELYIKGLAKPASLPYLNDIDVKNAYPTNITEINECAYRSVVWHINEVTDVNSPL